MNSQQIVNTVHKGFENALSTWPSHQQQLVFIMPTSAPTTLSLTAAPSPARDPHEIIEDRGILRAAKQTIGSQQPIVVNDAWRFTKFKAELSPELVQLINTTNGIAALTQPNGHYLVRNGVRQFRIVGIKDLFGGLIRFELRLMGDAEGG